MADSKQKYVLSNRQIIALRKYLDRINNILNNARVVDANEMPTTQIPYDISAPSMPTKFDQLSFENIQRALETENTYNVLLFRYGNINKWNSAILNGYPRNNDFADSEFAMSFKKIADKELEPYGYTTAFIAILPVNDMQFTISGKRAHRPTYDNHGTATVGTVGLYGPDGKLLGINPESDWICIFKSNNGQELANHSAIRFLGNGIRFTDFRKKLFARYIQMAAHNRGEK